MPKVILRTVFLFLVVSIAINGCKKDEILIPNNTAPPDSTISTLVIENYVTKCYISLLGREPSTSEEIDAVNILVAANMTSASRKEVLSEIIGKPEYAQKLVEYNSIKLLNNPLDTVEIQTQIYIYTSLLSDPQYAPFYDLINSIISNLETLLSTPGELNSGSIGIREMHRRMITNEIYDQINAGSFNYVLSLFNNFLFRDPTSEEHNSGITMVDGFVAVLFYETGTSKDEFIEIFLDSDDYFEGQVRELYLRYLFREPTSQEQGYHAGRYHQSDDFNQLQKDILSLDEFAGL